MSLTKMAPGAWGYYAKEIAGGREDYFAEGHQRGEWLGRGAQLLGIDGTQVSPEELERLFGNGIHPVSGAPLGLAFDRKNASTVAGFALTFSPPKSVSVLWAVGNHRVTDAVTVAQQIATNEAIGFLETHAAFTRRGRGGIYQVDSSGYVAAAFTHRTSRAGDPQLHTHVLVANKVQALDGSWLSIDARELYAHQKAAGMLYKAALRSELSTRLGVAWTPVDDNGIAEIRGVPDELAEAWSSRREELERVAIDIVAEREANLGRTLTADERADAFQIAAYQTRAPKLTGSEETAALKARWSDEADASGHPASTWIGDTLDRELTIEPTTAAEIVGEAIERLHEGSATWGRAEVVEVLTTLVAEKDAAAIRARVESLADAVTRDPEIVTLRAPLPVEPPAALRRSDGFAFVERHSAPRFVTTPTLDQEAYILGVADRGHDAGIAIVTQSRVEAVLAASTLGPDQAAAVRALVTGGDQIALLVGPAGAGKSYTLDAARAAFESQGHPVIGLAPSARAASVLSEEANLPADTIAKYIWEQEHGAAALRSGSVVIVDESSMATTPDLAKIVEYAVAADAKVVLVGDPHQLGAVGPGGVFATLVRTEEAGGTVAGLETVRRFAAAWERAASLQLRAGDASILAAYDEHGRIASGTREEMLDRAFDSWRSARDDGKAITVMAGDNATVQELSGRARADRVLRGEVEKRGVSTERGTVGIGDEIVTLQNARALQTDRGEWVRNGERWEVTGRDGGALTVRSLDDHGTVELPAAYVREHVTLAYAVTIHKTQGMTTNAGVVIVDGRMTSEQFLVGMTRGIESNVALVIADTLDPDHGQHTQREPLDVLRDVMGKHGADRSAHDVMRTEFGRFDDPRFRTEIEWEANRRIDALAGPDRTDEITKLERTLNLDGLRRELARRESEVKNASAKFAAAERAFFHLGNQGFDPSSAEPAMALAKHAERKALGAYDAARHDLYQAEQRSGELMTLREEQAQRDAWLDRHPVERAWLEEFAAKNAPALEHEPSRVIDPATWRTESELYATETLAETRFENGMRRLIDRPVQDEDERAETNDLDWREAHLWRERAAASRSEAARVEAGRDNLVERTVDEFFAARNDARTIAAGPGLLRFRRGEVEAAHARLDLTAQRWPQVQLPRAQWTDGTVRAAAEGMVDRILRARVEPLQKDAVAAEREATQLDREIEARETQHNRAVETNERNSQQRGVLRSTYDGALDEIARGWEVREGAHELLTFDEVAELDEAREELLASRIEEMSFLERDSTELHPEMSPPSIGFDGPVIEF